MVQRLKPACIWMQLGNFSFLMSGIFGDLMLIRICLVGAYIWLMTAAAVGYPAWPGVDNPGFYSLDGIIWAILNLFFHGIALFQLVYDERPITFHEEEHQQIWQLFYRRSGMGKLEFKQSMAKARVRHFKAGQTVLDADATTRTLMLLVEGVATYQIVDGKGSLVQTDTPLISGQTFDIGLLNVLGVYMAFEHGEGERRSVRAHTDVTVVFWDLRDLNDLATRCSPAVSAFWRNFALCQTGLEWFCRTHPNQLPVNGRGRVEPEGLLSGAARSSDFTDPLESWEDPSPTLRGMLAWLPSTLAPFLPPGMRHHSMPRGGTMARNRLMALGAAQPTRRADEVLSHEPLELRFTSQRILNAISAELEQAASSAKAAAVAV